MDGWSCAAVTVAFVGGFGLAVMLLSQHVRSVTDDCNRRVRKVQVVVVSRGRTIQQVARGHRKVLGFFGMAGIADQFEALGSDLVDCDDPNDPVPPEAP